MGKNKKKNNASVFKVAGAKGLKAKSKAKPVAGNLKNVILLKIVSNLLIALFSCCCRFTLKIKSHRQISS